MASALIEHQIKKYFSKFDKDGSGFISAGEVEPLLRQLLQSKGQNADHQQVSGGVSQFLGGLDANRDGKVSLQEFTNFAKQFFMS